MNVVDSSIGGKILAKTRNERKKTKNSVTNSIVNLPFGFLFMHV